MCCTCHPDDESMYCIIHNRFFGPTLNSLSDTRVIHLLCLSNGNFAGLGKIREKELSNAAKHWKIKHLKIIDDPNLQDSMKSIWDEKLVGDKVVSYIKENSEIKTVQNFIYKIDINF